MLFGAVAFWVRAMRWRLLIRGAGSQVSRGGAFDAVNISFITNFALPRAGEVARCGVLTKTSGAPFDALLGTVVLERLFDLFCLIVITILVVTLQWSVFGLFMEQQLWNPFVGALHGNLFIVAIVLVVFFAFIAIFMKRLKKMVVFKKMYNLGMGVLRGFISAVHMKQKAPFFGYTLALWLLYWATCRCTILAFPTAAGLNSLDALFLMAAGSLGWVVPVQGGIGAYHFIVSLALTSVYGISQTQSLVFATISHESQAVTMILFGLFSLIRIYFNTSHKK
jgi:uncharacterized membrane protein YbhN (UPF0104 family)